MVPLGGLMRGWCHCGRPDFILIFKHYVFALLGVISRKNKKILIIRVPLQKTDKNKVAAAHCPETSSSRSLSMMSGTDRLAIVRSIMDSNLDLGLFKLV